MRLGIRSVLFRETTFIMRNAITTLILSSFFAVALLPATAAVLPQDTEDPYHVMWTTKKGKAKCSDKGTKEKADKCAAKMKEKQLTGVQVMAGKCSSM